MDTAKNFIPVVKAVTAGLLHNRSIDEVRVSKTLRGLGLPPDIIPELTLRLYRAVGARGSGDFRQFGDTLSITPDSSIGEIAAHLAQAAAKLSGPAIKALSDDPTEPLGVVETAVRTAVAEASRTHSIGEIRAKQTLRRLGLDEADVADLKTSVYRMLSSKKVRPEFSKYVKKAKITRGSTVGEVVKLSRKAFMKVRDFTEDPTDILG